MKEKLLRQILSEQKKTNEILQLLKDNGIEMTDRQWRKFVCDYNRDFSGRDRYIASNRFGYFMTSSKKKITKSAMSKLRNGLAMVKNAKADLKELALKDQLSLLEEDVELYDLVMKMKEV